MARVLCLTPTAATSTQFFGRQVPALLVHDGVAGEPVGVVAARKG